MSRVGLLHTQEEEGLSPQREWPGGGLESLLEGEAWGFPRGQGWGRGGGCRAWPGRVRGCRAVCRYLGEPPAPARPPARPVGVSEAERRAGVCRSLCAQWSC